MLTFQGHLSFDVDCPVTFRRCLAVFIESLLSFDILSCHKLPPANGELPDKFACFSVSMANAFVTKCVGLDAWCGSSVLNFKFIFFFLSHIIYYF